MNVRSIAIGMTGGIGSGKTEACQNFASLGTRVLYADELARTAINSLPPIKKRIKEAFGENIYAADGMLDRKMMAKLIFQDDCLKDRLEAIVHPYVLEEIQRKVREARESTPAHLLIVEAALIFETGAEDIFDYVVVVDAPEEQRINRVMERDHVGRMEVMQRLNAQLSPRQSLSRADFVLHNDGDKTRLKTNCLFLYRLFMRLAGN
jgi:dephospho-CoA kinase